MAWFVLQEPRATATFSTKSAQQMTTEEILTQEELKKFDGTNAELPVYVAVKGTIFDVSASRDMYLPGKGYSVFAGKDASKALGKSSLDLKDCVADYSDLTPEEVY
jgi:predicted heme/steroid binding protein